MGRDIIHYGVFGWLKIHTPENTKLQGELGRKWLRKSEFVCEEDWEREVKGQKGCVAQGSQSYL